MITDYFKLAAGNLRKRKLRSGLTVLGIFIAVATIVVLISLSLGLQNAVKQQFNVLGGDKFFILPKGQAGAPGAGGAVTLTSEDFKVIEKVQGVKQAAYMTGASAKLEFNGKTRYYIVAAIPKDSWKLFEETTALKVDEGKDLDKAVIGDVALGSRYKTDSLFGKPVHAGDKIKINGIEVKVIAIMAPIGNPSDDQNVYMFLDTFDSIFGKTDRADEIIVQVDAGQDIKQVADKVSQKLAKFRGVKAPNLDFTILTPEELLASFGIILNILTAFLVGIAGISLVVGAIGIANTMYTSVLERTQEIGTMKAVGARNSEIQKIFLIESGILGMVGGALGVVLGYFIGKIIESYANVALGSNFLQASFPPYLIVGALAFGFGIGSLAGWFPSRQASKLNPTEALRYE